MESLCRRVSAITQFVRSHTLERASRVDSFWAARRKVADSPAMARPAYGMAPAEPVPAPAPEPEKRPKVDAKWIRTKADEQAIAEGCYFDEAAGRRVCDFMEKFLRLSAGKWAGQPFKLMDWQRDDVLMPLFGWKRADGTRRFRVGYVEIPKKNGKSGLCSGLSLYLLLADGEPAAQVFSAAADRQQASIVFNEAARMVKASPELARRLEVIDSRKTIAHKESGSFFRALAADSDSNEGLNIHALIFDELHAQHNPKLWDALRYGGAARRQPLIVAITTAGVDRNSIAWEQHCYAENILKGSLTDTSYFAYIRAADPDDDWKNPETWRKANPSLGVTISEADFAADCREAQEIPRKENPFKRYRLNIWTEQVDRWLSMEDWNACDGAVDEAALVGRTCYAGVDLSSKIDLTAVVYVFPPTDPDEPYRVLPRFWVPADNASQRETRDRVPYLTWMRGNLITGIDGPTIDQRRIKDALLADAKRFDIREIAFDKWNAVQFANEMAEAGATMVEFGQGFGSMSEPTKELERLVKSRKLAHGGHAVLRWMAGNVAVDQDAAGNVKPAKNKSTERIDGIVALIMALGRAVVHGGANGPSVYESRGVLVL